MQTKLKLNHQSRGAAMLLVLIAVAVCTILALSFLAAQEPTAVVASNIDRKTQARAIAESALQMAIDYVNEDADWRSDKSSGTWITDASMDGGTFTLTGIDEDDGDLADDSSEAVLLSVVANYQGVTHRVSAQVTPGGIAGLLLYVAGNGPAPSATDQDKIALFESWGYVVTVIDDGDSQSVYNAAAAVNDVAFVSEEVFSSTVNTKLRDVTIGVINDEPNLQDEMGFATGATNDHVDVTAIDIVNVDHPITSGLSIGSLVLMASGDIENWYMSGSVPSGATVLADVSGSNTSPVLMVADVGDTLHYGAAAGRRVNFPCSNDLDVTLMSAEGQALLQRCLEWAAVDASNPDTPQLLALYEFDQVTVAPTLAGRWKLDEVGAGGAGVLKSSDDITLQNQGFIDGYDSANGPYGGANQKLDVLVITNTTSSSNVQLDSATIYGSVEVGAGGDPSSVISLRNQASITGTQSAQISNMAIPTYDEPSGFPTTLGDTDFYSGGTVTWSTDLHYGDLTVHNGTQINVTGNIEVKIAGDFTLNNGDIVLAPGASLRLWIGQRVDINNGSTVNNDTSRAGDLELIQYGDSIDYDLDLNNGVLVGSIHCADDIRIYNGSAIYGSVVAEDDITIFDGSIHVDLSTAPPAPLAIDTPTIARDSSPLGNDGSVMNGPVGGVAGHFGTAYEFDGTDDYVEIPHDDSYLMQSGTFSAWFKADSLSGRRAIFSKDSSGFDTGGHFSVWVENSRIEVRMQSTTGSHFVDSPSNSIAVDTWYHIMFAWGEEGMALYLDGVLVDTDSYTGGLGTTSGGVGNHEAIVLGANAWQTGNLNSVGLNGYFDGVIDDLRVYNERLSEAQALEIYNGATEPSPFISEVIVEDTSGYETPLDLAVADPNAVTWSNGGLAFDGNTLAVSLSEGTKIYDAINTTGEFSVEVILQRASPGTTSTPSRIVAMADSASNNNFMLGQDSSNYEARVRDSSTGGTGVLSPEFVSSADLNVSGDTHVVLSYKDGKVRVYIDGKLDKTNTTAGLLNNWENDHYLVFGGAYGGSSYWQGTLKRIAIYDRGFDTGQADNVYNGNAPGLPGASGAGSVQWDELD